MGINATNLKNIERKIKEYNQNLTLFEQQFIIIPYLASGYVDYSNFGQVQGQYQIDNFETYKRIWTGNDSFIITWKDSVEFVSNDDGTKIEKHHKIGNYLLGWLENNSSTNDIATDQSFDYYKSQTSEQSLTFRINASKFNLDTNYEFMFYKVPEYSKDILYRVESIDREYVGKDLMCYVLRLKALNQDLANTGQAKQQNVMPNSPGQGYYAPSIVQEYQPQEGEKPGIDFQYVDKQRIIVIDRQKMLNRPVKKVVLKAFGLCIFSNLALWGRRAIYGGDFRDFGVPRWIFPINLTNASTQTIYRTQTSESNYYWISNAQPTIVFNKETYDALKSFFKTDATWTGQGFLRVDIQKTKDTNPSSDTTSYTYQLYGDNQLKEGKISNVPWTINLEKKVYRTDTIYGCEQYYNIEGSKRIHDAMFDTFWVQKNMIALPITSRNTMSFGWTLGAAYAAAVARNFLTSFALMLIGITGTIINKVMKPDFQGFSGIIPSSIFDFMANETNGIFTPQTGSNSLSENHIKLSYFENYDQENDINKFFNTQTINTSFEADLTDKITSDRLTYPTNQTTCIGQTQWDTGVDVCKDGSAFLLNGDAKLIELGDDEKDVGFIIDAFNIQAMFMGDFSIEFLDRDDTVIWTGIYQSQGKWTGSVREINTWINTSIYGRENMYLSQPLPWPKELPPLHLVGYEKPNVIRYEFNSLTRGYWRNMMTDYPNNTIREIIQNSDRLGLTWVQNVGTTYYAQNVNNRSQFVVRDEFILQNNWLLSLEDWINLYQNISIEFDDFNLSKWPVRTSVSARLKEGTISNNMFVINVESSGDSGNIAPVIPGTPENYSNFWYAWSTKPGSPVQSFAWCHWLNARVARNVKITIYKEEATSTIKMLLEITPKNAAWQCWRRAEEAGETYETIVDIAEWLEYKQNRKTTYFNNDGRAFFGTFVRTIQATPYQIPEQ